MDKIYIQADINDSVFNNDKHNFLEEFFENHCRFPLGKGVPKELASELNAKDCYKDTEGD